MPIEVSRARQMIEAILSEVRLADGSPKLDAFSNLRAVDAKLRDLKLILQEVGAEPLLAQVVSDTDFEANSRRVRLEAIANHCVTALRFFETGVVRNRKRLLRAPSFAKLTASMPGLEPVIQQRWLDAQKCQYAGAYVAAVVMMGSVLEALLLARCSMSVSDSYQSHAAPKERSSGRPVALPDWNLHSLIEVAVERGWLKSDRGKFSHALRESRNIVHPYEHARSKANFDEATCTTCWHVLNSSVDDLIASVPKETM